MAQRSTVPFQLRTLDLAMEQATEALPEHRPEVARELVEEALSIAYEHCWWAAERGHGPYEMLRELGIELSRLTSWGEALWWLADLWLDEVWPRLQPSSGRGQGGASSSGHKMSGAGLRGMCRSRRRRSRSRLTPHRSGGMTDAAFKPRM